MNEIKNNKKRTKTNNHYKLKTADINPKKNKNKK